MAYTENEYFNEAAGYTPPGDTTERLWQVLKGSFDAVNSVEIETPQRIIGEWCEATGKKKPFGLGIQNSKNKFSDHIYHTRRLFNMHETLVDCILEQMMDRLERAVPDARRMYYHNLRKLHPHFGSIFQQSLC